MAIRTKTIEYAFPTDTASVAAATRRDLSAITLFIPETASRTFRSVVVEIFARADVTASTSLTSWLIGIKLGAVAFDDVTITSTLTHSGLQAQSWAFQRDVTAYFNSNFGAGGSQTCQVGMTFGAVATINCHAKLIITYEYDDAAQTTRVKTVRIPIDGNTDTLTDVLAQVGANDEIPDLDDLLPEASKVYREIWFEIMSQERVDAAGDYQQGVRLDSEAEVLDGNHEATLQTVAGTWYKRIWVRDDLDTANAHSFSARGTVTGRFNCLAVLLCVTYEYNHTNSTAIMNSLMLPVFASARRIGGSVEADLDRGEAKLFIEEPGPISLVRSGYMLNYVAASTIISAALLTRAGSQNFRTYTYRSGTAAAGQSGAMKRIDAGGVNGAGATLARGLNTVVIDLYSSSTDPNVLSGLSGVLWLNYSSGKHEDGDGVHNHTLVWRIFSHAAVKGVLDLARYEVAAVAPVIPETNYYANVLGYLVTSNLGGQSGSSHTAAFIAQILSGEGQGDGWAEVLSRNLYWGFETTDFDRSLYTDWVPVSQLFDRFPADPDSNRFAVESARAYRYELSNAMATNLGILMLLTYHSIVFDIAGTVSGYSGDGSGIPVEAHRTDTDEKVGSAVTAAGGGYTIPWYDDTIPVYAHAIQSATRAGRSADGAAV